MALPEVAWLGMKGAGNRADFQGRLLSCSMLPPWERKVGKPKLGVAGSGRRQAT